MVMRHEELATFEGFCETLYNSPHAAERAKAEAALVQLSTAPEYIPRCQARRMHSRDEHDCA